LTHFLTMRFNPNGRFIRLSTRPSENVIIVCGNECILEELYENARDGTGGNSSVFRATDPASSEAIAVVKFCKFPVHPPNRNFEKPILRFRREIAALQESREKGLNDFIVKIVDRKVTEFRTVANDSVKMAWYAMENAQSDLRRFLAENELGLDQKFDVCDQLIDGLFALHGIGYYHRDLKPDNILLVDGRWKVGDLGLLSDREAHGQIDKKYEKIGPAGFLSPEATNKAFGNHRTPRFSFDCAIDERSDVYQLTLIIWFLFQDEVATGCMSEDDWRDSRKTIYKRLIEPGLQYSKSRRFDLRGLKQALVDERKTLKLP
jgi:serine/threonine protein kinase